MISSPYSPMAQYEMQFTPLLPSQLLMGSPFQPGTPAMAQFATFPGTTPGFGANGTSDHQYSYIPQQYYTMEDTPRSRTVYLGNVPQDTTAEELLNHVRSGVIENVKLVPEKNCAFISFLDHTSAAHFHSDAFLKKLSINGQDIKVGWGKSSGVAPSISLAVNQDGASRNVYLGALPDDITEDQIREDVETYGAIDTIKLVREKNIGFVHFLNIATAVKVVQGLQYDNPKWANRKIYYGKDRCAYISKTQQQNAAQYLGISPGYEHILATADRGVLSNALAQQSAQAIAVATAAGGANNAGNRTVYLGNVHPETTIEEICNVVRGGLLHTIRYIPEKHICFVTFVDPTAAAQFFAMANLHGLAIHNRRLKVGWGKHSGNLLNAVALAVTNGASRNVYIGNIDESWPETKLRHDFAEFGEIEQINFLPEKSCAFVNFTNITNAIKAIEGIKQKEDYKQFKINFGKDRCGNPPRQLQQLAMKLNNNNSNTNNNNNNNSNDKSNSNNNNANNTTTTNDNDDNNTNTSGGSKSRASSPSMSEYYYDQKFGFGLTASTPGSAILAQYLAQAQHDHYMYQAAAATVNDPSRAFKPANPLSSPTSQTITESGESVQGEGEEEGEEEQEGDKTPESTNVSTDAKQVEATVVETAVAESDAETEAETDQSEVHKSAEIDQEPKRVYGLAIES